MIDGFDLNIDFDFLNDEIDDESAFLKSKERIYFDVHYGAEILSKKADLPQEGESLRAISYAGGFSSCSVVLWIASKAKIKQMFVSTLRVGKKEIDAMKDLHDDGKLDSASFVLCGISKENKSLKGKDYGYTEYFEELCAECGFSWSYAKNHSKIILLDTNKGKFAIETSSNFNENPKIEQFCITKSDLIYDFYKSGIFGA